MHLVDTSSRSSTQTQTLAADGEHQQVAMASSLEHSEKSTRRSGGHMHKAAESKERSREKVNKGQGSSRSHAYGVGGAKKPSKRSQVSTTGGSSSGGHGRVKGRSKSGQGNEIGEDTTDKT